MHVLACGRKLEKNNTAIISPLRTFQDEFIYLFILQNVSPLNGYTKKFFLPALYVVL